MGARRRGGAARLVRTVFRPMVAEGRLGSGGAFFAGRGTCEAEVHTQPSREGNFFWRTKARRGKVRKGKARRGKARSLQRPRRGNRPARKRYPLL